VKDSGKGIRAEDIEKLFDEFAQFDVEKNKGIEGVGLGLAITRNIVKMMGGDIGVSSEYGKGSVFTVTLPQKYSSPDRLASVDNPEEKGVLVYERRGLYADSIVRALDNLGVSRASVSSDPELYDKMSARAYSFIFISFALFDKNKATIQELRPNARIVLLAEFGETVADKSMSVLAMPAHCISIANILNGVSNKFVYSESYEHAAKFVAPEAKILVVDDIRTNLKVAKGLLQPYKMQISLCKSGLEAIEAIKTNGFDLVFMDHKMPEMDGIEATRHIRAMGEGDAYYKSLPIIALTANAVYGTKEMFLENGFNDFLSKPIDTVGLNALLEKWLPREKRKNPAEELEKPFVSRAAGGIAIEGVDVVKGISLSGGNLESYLELLAVFQEDGFDKIGEIKTCLETGDLPLFVTHVHGLKSAAAGIGADKLSETAFALEMAGKRKDLSFIEALSPKLLADLESLLAGIGGELSAYRGALNVEGREPLWTQRKST
jgi:CheY-like chemotaxis protein/HPt (histidine-containing phosphotransfer) domain-containing protein